ncbi:MAG TPA: sigma-70 family RNA polymerase sigma factor [Bryobacteraceae bacterium]|nr:sigma-70 family RNA polymerase sigma factor [Bryobacteraceae bacterium]
MADTAVGLHVDGCLFSHAEEDALVSALGQGAEDAYEILIQRYQQPVYSLVCRLMNDPSDAPDIVQEVFLKVFRSIGAFRGNSSLKTWIYRIAVNEAYNHRRWFCRHQRQEVAMVTEEGALNRADSVTDPGRSPFEQAADHETRALVEQALEELNPKFRAAVVLRDIEDLSYEDIATVLNVSLGTVKSRIMRGREALRKILEGRLEPGRLDSEANVRWASQPVTE